MGIFLCRMKNKLTFLLFCLGLAGHAQVIDSLLNVYKKASHDTTKVFTLLTIGENIYMQDPDSAERIWKRCLTHCNQKIKLNSGQRTLERSYRGLAAYAEQNIAAIQSMRGDIEAASLSYRKCIREFKTIQDDNGLGNVYVNYAQLLNATGSIDSAIYYTQEALALFKKNKDPNMIGNTLNNLGLLCDYKGEIDKALKYYFEALKLLESQKNKKGMAYLYQNIGGIYDGQKDLKKAAEYYQKALTLRNEINDQFGIAESFIRIGSLNRKAGNTDKALELYSKALAIQLQLGDMGSLAVIYNNLGSVYREKGDLKKASDNLLKSMEIQKKINDINGLSYVYGNLSSVFQKMNNLSKALEYAQLSLKCSRETGYPENIKMSARQLTDVAKEMGNYKVAFEGYSLYIKMHDSLNNIETQKKAIRLQADYEYKQRKAIGDAENKAKLKQQEERAAIEKNKQYIIISSVSLVLLIAIVFSISLYKRFKISQEQKRIIELKERETSEQKVIIEEKHKEITDSINYAERIQRSCLATKKLLDEHLNDYFILYKPKSVVSGDFYWGSELSNGNFAFALADSTGHGVPGAIMSLLNIASLEKAVNLYSDPGKILDTTREIIIEKLKNDGSNDGGKDGMDCSLMVIDKKNKKLHVASANNPVWICRNNTIIEIKGDKMPVGKSDKQDQKFTNHSVDLNENDIIYTLTDGYADQFGGINGKKFMVRNLKELVLANSHRSLAEQHQILKESFAKWIGNLEQVDDVSICAIKI